MVRLRRVLLALMIVAAVLLASVFPAFAIDFVAEEKYESVFIIRSGNSLGSGFAMGSNCIVTNAHVIQNVRQVSVWSYDGTERRATVLGMDEDQDIAVLVVTDAQFPILSVAAAESMNTGDDVYAIGAPKSMAYTLTKGVISAKEREVGGYTYIQTDAPINEGNSGGPLLSASGEVLGMNTLKMNDSEGIGLAIPIARICQYLEKLGIGLDASGSVSGVVEEPTQATENIPEEPTYILDRPVPEGSSEENEKDNAAVVRMIAAISIVLNIFLIIALVREKRKKQTAAQQITMNYDPSERTDFEIDILE